MSHVGGGSTVMQLASYLCIYDRGYISRTLDKAGCMILWLSLSRRRSELKSGSGVYDPISIFGFSAPASKIFAEQTSKMAENVI